MFETVEPHVEAYFDGACAHNPGGYASYGVVILKNKEPILKTSGIVIPANLADTTNNIGEYAGYITVLEELKRLGLKDRPVLVRGDSKLVIEQMNGNWKIKHGEYVPLAKKAKALTKEFSELTLEWIDRKKNRQADRLADNVAPGYRLLCMPCIEGHEPSKRCGCICHVTAIHPID